VNTLWRNCDHIFQSLGDSFRTFLTIMFLDMSKPAFPSKIDNMMWVPLPVVMSDSVETFK